MKRPPLLALLAVLLAGCRTAPTVPEKIPQAVHTGRVELQITREETKYSADVMPESQVDLSFRVGGYVHDILQVGGRTLQAGDPVTSGQILARLRPAEYRAKVTGAASQVSDAQATLAAARAQLAEATAGAVKADEDLSRARALFDSRSLTKPDLDAAQAQRDAARAKVDAASAQTRSVQAKITGAEAQQTEAALALADTELRAPASGVILARVIENGTLVGPGTVAFRIADIRTVKVGFGVPDISVPSFRIGTSLPVSAEAVPNMAFTGRVTSISPAADPKSRVFTIEVSIPNPRRLLKPGMIASVTAGVADMAPVPSIPLSAVVESMDSDNRYAAFLLVERDGKLYARRQRILLGEVRGNRVTVKEGLLQGQRIVIGGGALLTDGESIREIP